MKDGAASLVSEKIFRGLGFGKRDAMVAMALMRRRVAKASEIASDIHLPRQTTYSILTKLGREGLVTPTSKGGVRKFMLDYGQLTRYIEERKEKLERLRSSLRSGYAPSIPLRDAARPLPRVTYYEGSAGLAHLFDSMLEVYQKGKSKKFRGYGVNFLTSTQALEAHVRAFLEERARLGVAADLFIAEGPDDFRIVDEPSRLGRTIKRLNIDEQDAGIYMVANRIYLFSFRDNVGVMVENQAIAEFLKSAFDDHWEKSP